MKKLEPVNIHVETCMDADDLGHRLTECIQGMSNDSSVVNLVKIHAGDSTSLSELVRQCEYISDQLRRMGATNCVFVPLREGYIEDVTVDYIKVVDDDTHNNTLL